MKMEIREEVRARKEMWKPSAYGASEAMGLGARAAGAEKLMVEGLGLHLAS